MSFLTFFSAVAAYNANYGNPEAGYAGNPYPVGYGMNPVSWLLYILSQSVCISYYLYAVSKPVCAFNYFFM